MMPETRDIYVLVMWGLLHKHDFYNLNLQKQKN